MTVYYVDPDATGDNDGGGDGTDRTDPTDSDNWTNAWSSIQTALDTVSGAGDIVYCRGTQTPSVQIDVDTNSGTADQLIRFIGCASNGAVDGTRFHLSFGANTCHGLYFDDVENLIFENFEISSSATGSYSGITKASSISSDICLINCYVHGWPDQGLDGVSYLRKWVLIRSRFSDNGGDGAYIFSGYCIACTFDNNDSDGIRVQTEPGLLYGCALYENGADGGKLFGNAAINCVFDSNNNDAMYFTGGSMSLVMGCRITNNGQGLDERDNVLVLGCYFDNNSSGNFTGNNYYTDVNPDGGGSLNDFTGGDTDQGYVAPDDDDYNLASDATSRNVALELQ